jgi:hypothetical protein
LSASINPGILPNAATPASHPDRRALLIQIAAVHVSPSLSKLRADVVARTAREVVTGASAVRL